MRKLLLLLVVLLFSVGPVHADIIGTFMHDYGSDPGKIDPGGNDVLSADYVEVSDQSSSRFSDDFDFSGLNYSSIDEFELTLRFRDTDDTFWFVFLEDWQVRPGDSSNLLDMDRVDDWSTQTFIIDSSIDTFDTMVSNQNFDLWFAEEAFGANQFKLDYAELEIHGTLVPAPAAVWLFVTGILGFAGYRKKLKA